MARKQHTSGFVYIWRDRKHNRYYVGSHWGTIDDGYVCSSTWMRNAYRKRPQDFKRRILKSNITDRKLLHLEEERWLQMMKPEELKGSRYYNISASVKDHWMKYDGKRLTIGQKISAAPGRAEKIGLAQRGRPKWDEDQKRHLSEKNKAAMTPEHRAHLSKKCSGWSHTDDARSRIVDALKGRPVSDETRAKISASNKGRVVSDKTRAKLSTNHKYTSRTPESKTSQSQKMRDYWSDPTRPKPSSDKTRERNRLRSGTKIYNDGVTQLYAKEPPPGFTLGKLINTREFCNVYNTSSASCIILSA